MVLIYDTRELTFPVGVKLADGVFFTPLTWRRHRHVVRYGRTVMARTWSLGPIQRSNDLRGTRLGVPGWGAGWALRWLIRLSFEPMLARRNKLRLTIERQR